MKKIIATFLASLQIITSTQFLWQSASLTALSLLNLRIAYAGVSDSAAGLPEMPTAITGTTASTAGTNPNYSNFMGYGKAVGDSFRETAKQLSPSMNSGKITDAQVDYTGSFPDSIKTTMKDGTTGVEKMNSMFSGFGYDSSNKEKYLNDHGANLYANPKGLDSLLADKSVSLSTEASPQGDVYRILTDSKPRVKFSGATNQITQMASGVLSTMESNKGFTTCKTSPTTPPVDYFCGNNNLDGQTCMITRDLKSKKLVEITTGSNAKNGSVSTCGVGCYELNIGDNSDNNVCGNGLIVNQDAFVNIYDARAITSVVLLHAEYDDWLKVNVNDSTVWSDWGAGERGTHWVTDPNLDITTNIINALQSSSTVKLTSVLGAWGCGEGYYKLQVKYDVSKALLESEWPTANSCFQNAARINAGKCTGSIACVNDFLNDTAIPLTADVFQIPSLFPSVAKTCKSIKVQTGSCEKTNVTAGASIPATVIADSNNNYSADIALNGICPSGWEDKGVYCQQSGTTITALKPIIKKYCPVGMYRSNAVGSSIDSGDYCTSQIYTSLSTESLNAVNSLSGLSSCDTYLLDKNCQFMSSVCGLKDFASGTCQISKNKFTCQTPGAMSCVNEGANPFVNCIETRQEVNQTVNVTQTDPRECNISSAPSTGSCAFNQDYSISTYDVDNTGGGDPCDMYYSSSSACKVLSSTPSIAKIQVATFTGTTSDQMVSLTTTSGSAKCSLYTKDDTCLGLSTYSCSNTLGFTDANAPLMSVSPYKGLPKICGAISVNYNCHALNVPAFGGVPQNQGTATSDCASLETDPKCRLTSEECVQSNGSNFNGECFIKDKYYDCGVPKGVNVTKTVTTNSCSPGAAEVNQGFTTAATELSALQEIKNQSKSCDTKSAETMRNCEIFKGTSLSCKRDMFGGALVDCCKHPDTGVVFNDYINTILVAQKADSILMGMPSDSMLGGSWATYVHNPIADYAESFTDTAMSYANQTWDTISTSFTSIAENFGGSAIYDPEVIGASYDYAAGTLVGSIPSAGSEAASFFGEGGIKQWAVDNVSSFVSETFGKETASLFFEDVGGTMAVGGALGGALLMVYNIYMYYQLLMMIAGLVWKCGQEEQQLGVKRDQKTCHKVASNYCHAKLDCTFCSICVEYRDRYCCFSSPLSRIMMEQIKPQLGIGWGSGKDPNCSGLRIGDVGRVNFSAIDLSEWIGILKVSGAIPTGPNFQNMTGTGNKVWNSLTPDRNNIYTRTEDRMSDMNDSKVSKTIEGVKDGIWNGGK
jgi:hypothetical protein